MTNTEIVLSCCLFISLLGYFLSDYYRHYCTGVALSTLENSIADSKRITSLLECLKLARDEVSEGTAQKINTVLAEYNLHKTNHEI